MHKTQQLKTRHPHILRPIMHILGAFVLLTLFAAFTPAKAQVSPLETAANAVLVVRSADNKDRFLGSAFVWSQGIVVTNAHVVGSADAVRLVDAFGRLHDGNVFARDAVRDVAVISVAGWDVPPLPHAGRATIGAEVWAIGAPLEMELTVTRGAISARPRQVDATVPLRFVQHDAAVNPGSSGGPLVDALGALVGMNSRIADGSRYYIGMSYAIGIEDLSRIVNGLIDETLAPFPKLGLQLRPVSLEVAAALGLKPTGVLIDRVRAGALAAKAGLRAGDIILTAGNAPLAKTGDLAFAIEAALESGHLPLEIWRDGGSVRLELPLVQTGTSALTTRGMEGAATLNRISSYRLEGLGLLLDDEGRVRLITENSPALFAGLIRGDVILAINGNRMAVSDLRKFDITAPALLLIQRAGGATLHTMLDPWDTGEGIRPVGGANVLDPAVVVF